MYKDFQETLSFDDVLLVPCYSDILSRTEVDTKTLLRSPKNKFSLSIPIISANMDTVTESAMAILMAKSGGLGIIHRFLEVNRQIEEVKKVKRKIVKISELAEPPSIGEKKAVEKVEAPPLKSTIAFLPPVVRPDEQVTEEYIPTVEELKNVDPGAKTQQGVEGGVDYSLLEVEETVEEKVVKEEKKEEPFSFVEEMPSYPGGNDELLGFFASNIQYPEIAKRAGVEGKVMVQFVVEKSGDITEIAVLKGIGAGCDEEAVKVARMMPRWTPGKQNGKPVRVRMVIPIHFRLQG